MNNTTLVEEPALAPFEDSSDLLDDVEALRARAKRDGYLFFRQLLPKADVLRVRDDLFSILVNEGSLDGELGREGRIDREHVDAIPAREMRLDIGISEKAYVAVQRSQAMHVLPHHPSLIALYTRLFGEEVFVHPRHIVRCMTGHPALRPTPPHQDFPLIQGSQNTWTAWFPLDDTPMEQGPLTILRGSHVNGYVPVAPAEGAGQIGALLCRDEDDWVGGGFEAGDVLTFPSLTVHRAVKATTKERIRLSMDVRYQPSSEPIEQRSLTNHSEVDWATIYENWPTEDMKYYWLATSPHLSPWDESYIQPGQRIC